MRVLVTGATGYVGSRVVPRLLREGHDVVTATRGADIADYAWAERVDTVYFDVEDAASIREATRDVDAVVYLVHSMDAGGDFVLRDRQAAERLAGAAAANDVQRIVYLSGLIPDDGLSDHLRSRLEVEQVLLDGMVPTVSLRAAMVIGSGSTSFELMRRMSERVPFTPIPLWMHSRLQPISVTDVVEMVTGALAGEPRSRHYDVGGPEQLTYPDLLAAFARADDLRRVQFPVLWAPKALVGRIIALVSGVSRSEVVALVDSLSHDMVCREDDANRELLPDGWRLMGLEESLQRSLEPEDDATALTGDRQASAPTDA